MPKTSNEMKKNFQTIQSLSKDLNEIKQTGDIGDIVENLPKFMERFEETESAYQDIMSKIEEMKQRVQSHKQT